MNQDFHKTKLKSGTTLLFEKRKLPVTTIMAATRAGAAYETEKDKGIAHFTEHMLFKGTEKRTQQDIGRGLEKLGGILNGFTSEQITAFWVKIPSNHSNKGAEILFDVIKNPKFDEKELEKEKNVVLSEIDMNHDWPRSHVLIKLKEMMYEKPFALPILGLKETVSSFNKNNFTRWHNFYSPNNLVISIVGKLSVEQISEIAKKYFEKGKNFPMPEVSLKKTNSEFYEERYGLDQTHFCLGFHVPTLADKQRYTSEVFNAVLGEGFSSVLHQEVRERRGYAYAIRSFLDQEKSYGMCVVYAGIEKKNLKEVKDIVLKEIKGLSKIKNKDFEEAKEQKIGNWKLVLEDSEKVATSLIMQEIATKAEEFYEYEQNISDVKIRDFKNMAKIRNYSLSVIAPKKK